MGNFTYINLQIYKPADWGRDKLFKFEYTDQGKKVSELSQALAPRDYWRSFKEMERQVSPKRREWKKP